MPCHRGDSSLLLHGYWFSKLGLGGGRSSDTERYVPYEERLQKENFREPGMSGDEMRHVSSVI